MQVMLGSWQHEVHSVPGRPRAPWDFGGAVWGRVWGDCYWFGFTLRYQHACLRVGIGLRKGVPELRASRGRCGAMRTELGQERGRQWR